MVKNTRTRLQPNETPVDRMAICAFLAGALCEMTARRVAYLVANDMAWHDAYWEARAADDREQPES